MSIVTIQPPEPSTPVAPIGIGTPPAAPQQPVVLDPGMPYVPTPGSLSAYIAPLPPDYEEFRVRATFNGIDETNETRFVGMFAYGLDVSSSGYCLYIGNGDQKFTPSTGGFVYTVINNKLGVNLFQFSDVLSIARMTPFAGLEPFQLVLGMNAPTEYHLPNYAAGFTATVDLNRDGRPTLNPVVLGLQGQIIEFDFLNCRLEGLWDLRGHTAATAVRFYGCPSWSRVRLPAVPGLEVSIDDTSGVCDLDNVSLALPAWAEFFANLPDLSGQIGGVIVGPASIDFTDPDVGLLPPLWAASGAAAKNWTLI